MSLIELAKFLKMTHLLKQVVMKKKEGEYIFSILLISSSVHI